MIREAIGHKCDLANTCVRRNGRDGRGGEAEEDEGDDQAHPRRSSRISKRRRGPPLPAARSDAGSVMHAGERRHGYVSTREAAIAPS